MVISLQTKYLKRGDIRPAFTMIELVFVIVILGILAAVAIPKLAASRDDAVLVKGKSQISAIRSGLSLLKSKMLLEGNTTAITALDNATVSGGSIVEGQELFNGILEYPILSKNADGNWLKTTTGYSFKLNGQSIPFTYSPAKGFDCNSSATSTGDNCKSLLQ